MKRGFWIYVDYRTVFETNNLGFAACESGIVYFNSHAMRYGVEFNIGWIGNTQFHEECFGWMHDGLIYVRNMPIREL